MTNSMEYPYSASFRLYRPDGLNVLFTVKGADPAGHVGDLVQYLAMVETAGYLVNMPGTEPGEKVEEVDAWVLGETSDGHPCVYLYSANHALKWKVATVYVEKFDELPFVVGRSVTWPGGAPEREVAEKKQYLHTADPFKIVLKPTGKQTDSGAEVMKFDRVIDAVPASARNGVQPSKNGNGNGHPFYGAMADQIPFFTSADEVERVMKLLGVGYPKSKAMAAGIRSLLEAFAGLRADGVEEDLAVIHVKDGSTAGEPGLTDEN